MPFLQHSPPPLRRRVSLSCASAAAPALPTHGLDQRDYTSSTTWSVSSQASDFPSESEQSEDRSPFVEAFNQMATEHGLPLLDTVYSKTTTPLEESQPRERRGWFSRTFLRHSSSTGAQGDSNTAASSEQSDKKVYQKRSLNDLTLSLTQPKKDSGNHEDLKTLVRLSGKSLLNLPPVVSPGGPLVVPTCLRVTAEYLLQHGPQTRGIFRIPGSLRVVNSICEYYLPHRDVESIKATALLPKLPDHIDASVHDVASVFKKILGRLPGGILGSLTLFRSLASVRTKLDTDPHFHVSTARLIALAMGTLESQYRRDLVCVVFGLLSMIGHVAARVPRTDNRGDSPPVANFMTYNSLGIIFGPLLVGDLLSSYVADVQQPANGLANGLASASQTPSKIRKQKLWNKSTNQDSRESVANVVDNIHAANGVAEMLISRWSEIVQHIRNLGVLANHRGSLDQRSLRSAASDSYMGRSARETDEGSRGRVMLAFNDSNSHRSQTPCSMTRRCSCSASSQEMDWTPDFLAVKRRRSTLRRSSSGIRSAMPAISLLSPTVEESPTAKELEPPARNSARLSHHHGERVIRPSHAEIVANERSRRYSVNASGADVQGDQSSPSTPSPSLQAAKIFVGEGEPASNGLFSPLDLGYESAPANDVEPNESDEPNSEMLSSEVVIGPLRKVSSLTPMQPNVMTPQSAFSAHYQEEDSTKPTLPTQRHTEDEDEPRIFPLVNRPAPANSDLTTDTPRANISRKLRLESSRNYHQNVSLPSPGNQVNDVQSYPVVRKAAGGTVKEMAARFESAAKHPPSPRLSIRFCDGRGKMGNDLPRSGRGIRLEPFILPSRSNSLRPIETPVLSLTSGIPTTSDANRIRIAKPMPSTPQSLRSGPSGAGANSSETPVKRTKSKRLTPPEISSISLRCKPSFAFTIDAQPPLPPPLIGPLNRRFGKDAFTLPSRSITSPIPSREDGRLDRSMTRGSWSSRSESKSTQDSLASQTTSRIRNQVRLLQQDIKSKRNEISRLKRQAGLRGDLYAKPQSMSSDPGSSSGSDVDLDVELGHTLRQVGKAENPLEQALREARIWRERANAAERRVVQLERLITTGEV